MWINPRIRSEREAELAETRPKPPEPTGRTLAALPRASRNGPKEELRVELAEFNGHHYISIRLWSRDQGGGWWPVKGKGVSVRLSEARAVADALIDAGEIEPPGGSTARTRPDAPARPPARRDRDRPDRKDWSSSCPPPAAAASTLFDETTPADDGPRAPWEG